MVHQFEQLYLNLAESDPIKLITLIANNQIMDDYTEVADSLDAALCYLSRDMLNKYIDRLLKHRSREVRETCLKHLEIKFNRYVADKSDIIKLSEDEEIDKETRMFLNGMIEESMATYN